MNELTVKSEAAQDYLKAIYYASAGDQGASQTDIAAQTGVSLSGVSKMLRQLDKQGLVTYKPYHSVHLTEEGRKVAMETIRHHRLLEMYLTQLLGYSWENVHNEAHHLEHHISEQFEDTIDRLLGYPKYDPHGDPIPERDGTMPEITRTTLAEKPAGSKLRVSRVTDEDPELLRYLGEKGLIPGAEFTIKEKEPFGGSIVLDFGNRIERVTPDAAKNIFVKTVSEEELII
jgi:DtxR family Mn-dependent transcriptional regulator